MDAATRLAVRLRWSHITYVGDNLAALQVILHMRPTLRNLAYTRITRRIRNRLFWSGVTVALLWVPSALQPADPLSRCLGGEVELFRSAQSTSERWQSLLANLSCAKFLGYAHA